MPQTWLPGDEIAVEVAWGADLTADPSTWVWTDITEDVYQEPGVSYTLGRGDEASVSQPATCSLLLRNESGDYSLGGQSANWPNVRRGTPVRVRVDPDNTGLVVAFQGAATGFTPSWDLTGTIPAVALEAAGVLRRLGQGQSPLQSSLRRALSTDPSVIAYWSCEEGKGAGGFIPTVGPYFMSWDTPPDLAANDEFPSSRPIPVLKESTWTGAVAPHTNTGVYQLDFIAYFEDSANEPNPVYLATIQTNNAGAYQYILVFQPPGDLTITILNSAGSAVDSITGFDFELEDAPFERRFTLRLEQSGGNVNVTWGTIDANGDLAGGFGTGSLASATLGTATLVKINDPDPAFRADAVAVGHVVLRNAATTTLLSTDELTGYIGETATDRIQRLCDENGELVDIIGTSTVTMGPQTVATFLELLREAEAADGGILLDGLGPGLTYISRTERENRPTDLTVDAGAGKELAPPFAPVDDDQRTRNRAEVTRKDAGTFVHEDVTGLLGSGEIGTYDTSATVNVDDDGQAQHYAEWLVHLGTHEGYRYPELSFDLRATPLLGPGVLQLRPSSRVDVDDLDDTLTAHPGSGLSLLVEGLEANLTGAEWRATAKCSPFDPWRVAQLSPAAAGVAFIAQGAVSAQGTPTTLTPALPAGLQPGDVTLCWATVRTGAVVAPDGWEELVVSGNCSLIGRVHREGETAGPPLTFTGTVANGTAYAQCFGFRGVHRNLAELVHISAESSNASAQNITVPALTITEDDCLVLVLGWKADDWTSVAALAGQFFTELSDTSTTTGDDVGLEVQYRVNVGTNTDVTATSLTVTGGASAISRAVVVALRPDLEAPITRLDTAGSTLNGSITAGATSISVTTASGPVWTTTSTDMPYDLDIGGVKITVTACSDGTSPQTMTIAAAPVARTSGAPVQLWRPPVLAR